MVVSIGMDLDVLMEHQALVADKYEQIAKYEGFVGVPYLPKSVHLKFESVARELVDSGRDPCALWNLDWIVLSGTSFSYVCGYLQPLASDIIPALSKMGHSEEKGWPVVTVYMPYPGVTGGRLWQQANGTPEELLETLRADEFEILDKDADARQLPPSVRGRLIAVYFTPEDPDLEVPNYFFAKLCADGVWRHKLNRCSIVVDKDLSGRTLHSWTPLVSLLGANGKEIVGIKEADFHALQFYRFVLAPDQGLSGPFVEDDKGRLIIGERPKNLVRRNEQGIDPSVN